MPVIARLANPNYCPAQARHVGAEAKNPRCGWAKYNLVRIAHSYGFLAELPAVRPKTAGASEKSQEETNA
jgi:hypothetical protein